MADKLLISVSDIKKYRAIPDLHPDRIDTYIRESQIIYLKPLLNDALYYDFILKYSDSGDAMYANYQKLLNGDTYSYNGQTVEYLGLKPMLVYYTLSRFVVNNQVNFTGYGVVYKRSDESDRLDADSLRMQQTLFKETALTYQKEVEQYLSEKTDVFTLYDTLEQKPLKTGFSFFKG